MATSPSGSDLPVPLWFIADVGGVRIVGITNVVHDFDSVRPIELSGRAVLHAFDTREKAEAEWVRRGGDVNRTVASFVSPAEYRLFLLHHLAGGVTSAAVDIGGGRAVAYDLDQVLKNARADPV